MVASCLSWFSVFITSNDKTLKRGCQEDISFGLAQHVLFYFAIVVHDYVFYSSLLKKSGSSMFVSSLVDLRIKRDINNVGN
jgi:hypothetical protein